jgi:hypothetical protein
MKFYCVFLSMLLSLSFTVTRKTDAQKIYIPTAEKYVPMDYKDDIRNDLSQYNGSYVYVYPGYDENDQYEGNPYIYTLTITSNRTGSEITAFRYRQFAVDDPIKNTPLDNPSIVSNVFYSDEITGKFVILKYVKNGRDNSSRGFFRKHKQDSGYDFYEKQ